MDRDRSTTPGQREPKLIRLSRREFLRTAAAAGVALPAIAASDQSSNGRRLLSLNGTWKIHFDEAGRCDFGRIAVPKRQDNRLRAEPGAVSRQGPRGGPDLSSTADLRRDPRQRFSR